MQRIARLLVRFFPRAFRDEFGSELLGYIAAGYDRARQRGRFAALNFVVANAVDMIRSAVAERWEPTVIAPHHYMIRRSGMRWLIHDTATDLRQAARRLRRAPGFTIIAAGTLGLAVGAAAVIFAVVHAVLIRPLPYAHSNRLVYIAATAPGTQLPPEFGVGNEFYLQYREHSRLLEDLSTFNSFTSTLRVGDRVERIRMSSPTWTLFNTLGEHPILGRLPVAGDEDRVAVISWELWQTWFGGDSNVVGRSYSMSGTDRTVIGVMGRDFRFPIDGTMLWFPMVIRPNEPPGRFGTELVGRVRSGVTSEALARELDGLARQLPDRVGGSPQYRDVIAKHHAVVRPMMQQMVGPASTALWVLMAAVMIVLVIACANVANLIMVRAEGRLRDLAVRRAIGARRGQLIRMQLSESFVIAILAGLLAVVLARVGLPLLLRVAPEGVPRLSDATSDTAALGFTLLLVVLAALACGLWPAIRASEPDVRRLREGGRGSTRGRHWLRDGLVVTQTALALVLLIGSGLLMRSFTALAHVRPGYDTSDIFTFQIAPERPTLKDGPTFARFHFDFMDRLRALPGVELVGVVNNIPLDEGTPSDRFVAEGGPSQGTLLHYNFSAGDYFAAMKIPVLEGRQFTSSETLSPNPSVILSRTAAKLLFGDQDPLGRRMQSIGDSTWSTVVGVVGDVMQNNFRDPVQPVLYLPLTGATATAYSIGSPAYVVKTRRAEVIAPEVRALVHQLAPEAPMYRIFTLKALARRSVAQVTFTLLTLGIASVLALILGTVGLYGVLSYVVAQRTREIGVRMALGAEAGSVRRMIVLQGAKVVGLGAAIGVVAAFLTTSALGSLLFGVAPVDLATFAVMSILLLGIGALASYIPARHASNVDPIESLRSEA